MNLVFHQLKKDILRTRVVLAIWLLLVVLRFALVGWTANSADTGMQTLYPMLAGMLNLLNALLVLVLVPLIIHQEPLVGTTAFWFTRPLPRSVVIASKALYILMLIVLPLIAQSIVFLANGITPHDVALAVPQLFLQVLYWIILAAAIAVLTPNFARFAIVCATTLVGWFLCIFALQYIVIAISPQGFSNTVFSLYATRGLVNSLAVIFFGGAAVFLQYFTRRKRLAISCVVTGALLALLASYFWPWDFFKPRLELLPDPAFKAEAITTELSFPIQVSDRMSFRGKLPDKQISDNLNFKGRPPGYTLRADNISSVLTSADGQKISIRPIADNQMNYYSRPNTDALELALGGVTVVNLNERGYYYSPSILFVLDPDIYDRYRAAPVNYSATFNCVASKYVSVTELPLVKGSQYEHGSDRITITDVLHRPDGVDILLRQRRVRLLFSPRSRDRYPYMDDGNTVAYVLLNKTRHQAVVQKDNSMSSFGYDQSILNNTPRRLSFGPDDNNRQNNWLMPNLDEAWLSESVLVRLELTPVASFRQTLAIPDFNIEKMRNQPSGSNLSQYRFADLKVLEKIVLPHDATRQQVKDYITAILLASRQTNYFTQTDPQIEMLEQVGAQNVDLLIQMAQESHNYYLNRAINKLVQPDQKDMVIAALAINNDLIDTIVDHGWQADAKPVLLALFNQGANTYIPYNWVYATISLKDPSTYPALKECFIRNPNLGYFTAFKALPDFDLAGTLDAAWKKNSNTQIMVANLLSFALQYGEPDAIDVAVKLLKAPHGDEYGKQRARSALKELTPAKGDTDEALVTWLESNKANLTYDPQTQKYVLGTPAAASSPAPAESPTPAVSPLPTATATP